MMMTDPWAALLNQSGGGSIDMSRGSSFGNLPPLDWMPNPAAAHGVDVKGQFGWNIADTRTYFQWYELVLFERQQEALRQELRRWLLEMPIKPRILLAGKIQEIEWDPVVAQGLSVGTRKVWNGVEYELVEEDGRKVWRKVDQSPTSSTPLVTGAGGGRTTTINTSYQKEIRYSLKQLEELLGGTPPPTSRTPAATLLIPPIGGSPGWAPSPAGRARPSNGSLGESRLAPTPPSPGSQPPGPPPPVFGGTSDALYVHPFWSLVSQRGWEEAQKASPDWVTVASGIIASPLAHMEESLLPLVNTPHRVVNNAITAGLHLGRASLFKERGEWAEMVAEGLDAYILLSMAFLEAAAVLEPLGSKGPPAPRTSLPREIPASVPRNSAGTLEPQLGSVPPSTSEANLQHVLRGGSGERGIGVLHIDVSKLNPSEIESTVEAVRDMDFQAGIADGLVRTSVPSRSVANSVATLGNKTLSLGPTEAAGHLPDVAGGGNALGPIVGIPKGVNSSIGGQWRRYAPGFTFDGYSLVDRATGEFLYISQALENLPAPILGFRRR